MTAVVYIARFIGSDRVYVGSTMYRRVRWSQHHSLLRRGAHSCIGMARAVAKYGIDALRFEVLEEVSDIERLLVREQWWIDKFRGRLLNASLTAGSNRGLKKSPDQIEKSARWHRGKKVGRATRARLSEAMKGNTNGRYRAQQFCGAGHEMAGENIYRYRIASGQERRACRACQQINNERQKVRRRKGT